MSFFNIVAATNEDTVVAAYEPSKVRSDSYQSEAELEKEFIRLLCEQGYTYLPLHTEDELITNLRSQLEELNHYQFSDTEWRQFFSDVIANPNEHIPEKTRKIQEDNVQVLHRDDGSSKNITLIDKKNIHNNRLQVINQYEVKQADGARHDNRYDVTILVNGFPLVHVELKRRGVAIREAFNQINRYQRDSFWAGCGLYEYDYALEKQIEISFGNVATTVFSEYRTRVENEFSKMSKENLLKLQAIEDKINSENPELYSQALTTCRRLFEGTAKELFEKYFPEYGEKKYKTKSGKEIDVSGEHYKNKLSAVIEKLEDKSPSKSMVGSNVIYLLDWIDNLTELQCKGVHHEVTRRDATRCIIQTYICLGDILSLQDE